MLVHFVPDSPEGSPLARSAASVLALRQGAMPSTSMSSEKLSAILTATRIPSTPTLSRLGSTVIVSMMSAATRTSSPRSPLERSDHRVDGSPFCTEAGLVPEPDRQLDAAVEGCCPHRSDPGDLLHIAERSPDHVIGVLDVGSGRQLHIDDRSSIAVGREDRDLLREDIGVRNMNSGAVSLPQHHAAFGDLDHLANIDLVAQIPEGLPSFTIPSGISGSDWLTLLLGGAVVALVGFSEGWGASQMLAKKTHDQLDANQEFRAYGVGNLGAGVLGGMVVTGVYTSFDHRKASFDIMLARGVDLEAAASTIVDAVRGADRVVSDPAPSAQATALQADAITVSVAYWYSSSHLSDGSITHEAIGRVDTALADADMVLAAPLVEIETVSGTEPEADPASDSASDSS